MNTIKDMRVEYGVERLDGSLINYFTWRELLEYFKGVSPKTLRSASQRGGVFLGQYHIYITRYMKKGGEQ